MRERVRERSNKRDKINVRKEVFQGGNEREREQGEKEESEDIKGEESRELIEEWSVRKKREQESGSLVVIVKA